MNAQRTVLLYGTSAPPVLPRRLFAGALSADLQDGNLRAIRYGGVEIIRAVSFLVRSPLWATYAAELTDLVIEEHDAGFRVTYRATVRDGVARLDYAGRIDGHADGRLAFHCEVDPISDFVTCRAGFVVLHTADVAGRAVRVEHADGSIEDECFPVLIDPVQPMLDLRALTHEAAPGLLVSCRMDGDVFEMEDQRNWTDASFKTYVRPLSRPWPYTLPAGGHFSQSVTLSIEGTFVAAAADEGPVRIESGEAAAIMPPLGLGCTPDEARAALPMADRLARVGITVLVCRFDPGQGHVAGDLAMFRDLATAIGAEVELQIVLHSIDDYAAELQHAAEAARAAGITPCRIAISPAPDLKSTTPGQPWPHCAPLDRIYAAACESFPGVPLAGGTFAYFTELNRKRPPLDLLDAVTFSTSPLVHAADDCSVMQSLQALPAVAASARAIAGDRKLVVGPSAIGFRDNPYGPVPVPNPNGERLPMSGEDPRQRGLFNAAWTLGHIAAFATAGVARVAIGAPVGPHGLLDKSGAYPVLAVLRGLAALRGATLHATFVSHPEQVAALVAALPDRRELWLANLTDTALSIALPEFFRNAACYRLDADSLAAESDGLVEAAARSILHCDAYSIWSCRAQVNRDDPVT